MQKHCYLTRRVYNDHPIGSKCFALSLDGGQKLLLEFVNGDVIEVPGSHFIDFEGRAWPRNLGEDLVPLWGEGKYPDDEIAEPINEMIMQFKREAK